MTFLGVRKNNSVLATSLGMKLIRTFCFRCTVPIVLAANPDL